MAAVTPADAQTPKRAVGCCFIWNRLLHVCLMPVDHSSGQGLDTNKALPRGALSPNGGRLSDGWRQVFRAGKEWSNSELIAIILVASLIVTVLPGIVVLRGQRDDTSSYGSQYHNHSHILPDISNRIMVRLWLGMTDSSIL
jgi:hypothetical protein